MIEFRVMLPNPFWTMGLGALAMVKGAWHMWEGEGSTSWPKIEGTVRATRAKPSNEGANVEYYEAIVEYEYQPRDQVLIATRWSYGEDNRFPTKNQAEYFLTRFTPGMHVDVFYDPKDLERSVLVQGKGNDGMTAALLGATIFIFGLYILLKL